MKVDLIVTRHPALVDYLREQGLADEAARVIQHATAEDVRSKRVAGVLPLALAALADYVLSVDLDLPAELRGVELTLEQVRQYATQPAIYRVTREFADHLAARAARPGWDADLRSRDRIREELRLDRDMG